MKKGKIEITVVKGIPAEITLSSENMDLDTVIEVLEKTAKSMKQNSSKIKKEIDIEEHDCSTCKAKPLCDMIYEKMGVRL